jgi:hypothetical protein
MHDHDTVLVSGFGTMRREQARHEAAVRFTQTGFLIQSNHLPEGFIDLATAFLAAANGPAWEEHVPPFTD